MALWPLKNISDPVGRANVPVVDEFGETCEQDSERSSFRRKAYNEV